MFDWAVVGIRANNVLSLMKKMTKIKFPFFTRNQIVNDFPEKIIDSILED